MTLVEEIEFLRAENAMLKKTIDEIKKGVPALEGEDARFTRREREILAILQASIGQPVRHATIWNALYGLPAVDGSPNPDVIKVYMSKTRKKLKAHKITVDWGYGYKLEKLVAHETKSE